MWQYNYLFAIHQQLFSTVQLHPISNSVWRKDWSPINSIFRRISHLAYSPSLQGPMLRPAFDLSTSLLLERSRLGRWTHGSGDIWHLQFLLETFSHFILIWDCSWWLHSFSGATLKNPQFLCVWVLECSGKWFNNALMSPCKSLHVQPNCCCFSSLFQRTVGKLIEHVVCLLLNLVHFVQIGHCYTRVHKVVIH